MRTTAAVCALIAHVSGDLRWKATWPTRLTHDCESHLGWHRLHVAAPSPGPPALDCDNWTGATSEHPLILGTGLGGTGSRSIAAAVRQLGYRACHKTERTHGALVEAEKQHSLTQAFARADAWFDNPVGQLLAPLACSFPNYRVIHTVRSDTSTTWHSGHACNTARGEHLLKQLHRRVVERAARSIAQSRLWLKRCSIAPEKRQGNAPRAEPAANSACRPPSPRQAASRRPDARPASCLPCRRAHG